MSRLTFWGAAGTVTGSKYLLEIGEECILVDYGMFQGHEEIRALNREPAPVDPRRISSLLLTHAHIDHSGLIPRLIHEGFRGKILCTPPTYDLVRILLLDSAHLQSEDHEHHRKHDCSDCEWVQPLYGPEDVEETMKHFVLVPYGEEKRLSEQVAIRFLGVGHILGSSMISIRIQGDGRERHLLFSGDVGRFNMPLNRDPGPPPSETDFLILESTYGDRLHPKEDLFAQMERIGKDCISRRGILLIPSFAVGRAQQLLLIFRELFASGRLPPMPIHLDSPMAVDVTDLYSKYRSEIEVDIEEMRGSATPLYGPNIHLHRTRLESIALNTLRGPAILISSSGMLTGGRILHHLIRLLPDEKNTVMLVGYQAEGTLGRAIQNGAKKVRIFHQDVEVHATLADLRGLSAHADYEELLRWLQPITEAPQMTFLTHGEEEARKAFALFLRQKRHWEISLPHRGESVEI